MSAPKATCPDCRLPLAECLCDDAALFPPAKPKTETGECRFCHQPVARGPHGFHDISDGSPVGYGCTEAPLGWHSV